MLCSIITGMYGDAVRKYERKKEILDFESTTAKRSRDTYKNISTHLHEKLLAGYFPTVTVSVYYYDNSESCICNLQRSNRTLCGTYVKSHSRRIGFRGRRWEGPSMWSAQLDNATFIFITRLAKWPEGLLQCDWDMLTNRSYLVHICRETTNKGTSWALF